MMVLVYMWANLSTFCWAGQFLYFVQYHKTDEVYLENYKNLEQIDWIYADIV